MLKTPHGPTSKPKAVKQSLIVFRVGGRRLAVQAEDVGGVRPWTGALPVPSRTPFIKALVRHGDEVLPVYDLAGRFRSAVTDAQPLCLVAKRRDGPMAICIDADIPTLQSVDPAAVRRTAGQDPDMTGTCQLGAEEVPVYSLKILGLAPSDRRG
jgi:chemotaxis signal transduction protein